MDIRSKREKAKELRQAGDLPNAWLIYEELWSHTGEQIDAAGKVNCLRKQGKLEEAKALVASLEVSAASNSWLKLEAIWTYVGLLKAIPSGTPLQSVVELARKITELNPEPLPLQLAVFSVLKAAKQPMNCAVMCEWSELLNPQQLNDKPPVHNGKAGWSDRESWYNYRLSCLFGNKRFSEVVKMANEAAEAFPRRKNYRRWQAKALCESNQLKEGLSIYKDLCRDPRSDWWLLSEYSRYLAESGEQAEALILMCRAAQGRAEPGHMVKLYGDLGRQFRQIGEHELAKAHFSLALAIRRENGWNLGSELLTEAGEVPHTKATAFRLCRDAWVKYAAPPKERKLEGRIGNLNPSAGYCFITASTGESVFAHVSDLPPGAVAGARVTFVAVPSYDKKKDREGLKARNIQAKS